jgi:hypothetical protein
MQQAQLAAEARGDGAQQGQGDAMLAAEAGMSPRAISKSPISATDKAAGSIQERGWAPSTSMRLACRIACGPPRAPLRLVVPISSGTPAMV